MPHARHLRKGRCSLPGHCYLVTIVTSDRRTLFQDHANARAAARTFYAPAIMLHGNTLSYVVMPDHIHWLVQLKGDLSVMVRFYKAKVTREIGESIWQRGFHDHAIRAEEDLRQAARYIVANPLRAGLVKDILQYPYWNAVWL
ncbi:REP-associated tyrosine transposase [Halomonas campaniensis]|jgi:putative transposase|uniref:REP-associated tyrosine transposase n=1 Tax=Halomonas campaniensis TaxID=213554 RepID=UPI0039710A26